MNSSRPTADDLQYLRLLSIFHYLIAALATLCGFFPFLHLAFGIGILTGAFDQQNPNPPPRFMGWFVVLFAGAAIVIAWAFAAGMVVAAGKLRRHQSYMFCVVMAAIACLFQPFGTVLGVFTLVVLFRPGVKTLFGRNGGESAGPEVQDDDTASDRQLP